MSQVSTGGMVLAGAVVFALGLGTGWWLRGDAQPSVQSVPEHWVARIDDGYLTREQFIDEMRRHGGDRPGQFQNMDQKRALLDELVYRAALVKAAEEQGLTRTPEVGRAIEQIISNSYLKQNLRQAQREITVSDEDVERFYKANAEQYMVPARKRVAMVRIEVPAKSDDAAWGKAEKRAAQALAKAKALKLPALHFGDVAREYSDDAASRYRGGVIGWIAELKQDRYRHDPVVIEAVRNLEKDGDIKGPLRGADGVYLVRLVENQPRKERSLEELSAGIRQRLVQERLAAQEKEFRSRVMRQASVQVDEAQLAAIEPLGPPASTKPQQPPAMPSDQG
ncbi:MAG: peptidyl-prolyl cis-trans isomerase [Lysobacteraceae bacterium]|jgi:parvulin-like peptidyl-prolyl isomerase